jgi:translation initiation factor 2-alpha kinase 4
MVMIRYLTIRNGGGSSRYKSDFIELGVLGRGGGGEVVKVRNRLDRRIYAIKKIILESEQGKFAKAGAIQNRKLRREVTTISRMTHTNIVRYYQAWVEGGVDGTIAEEAHLDLEATKTEQGVIAGNEAEDESEGSSSEEDSGPGYWAKPPAGKFFSDSGDDDSSGSSASSSGSSIEEQASGFDQQAGDDFLDTTSTLASGKSRRDLHSQSMENLLALEHDPGFQVRIDSR